ncbi:hypothetical protein L6452_30613 [Arctium lappa]|uniref:Uncharacterized protein n=1 Tax=Arctium lappa TaxID=4217 RepID=A0ACB8ZIP1_ARCLA|nr:hypothetical protein L6452_30613 [Arctium lappa]
MQVHGFVHDNRTGEKVAMLMGKWDEAMYYVLGDPTTNPKGYDPMTEVVLLWERDKSATKTRYNFTPFAISSNEITPSLREKLPPTDSRLRPDQRHLENGECELANAEKLRLEQLQRQENCKKEDDDHSCSKWMKMIVFIMWVDIGKQERRKIGWNSRYIWTECRRFGIIIGRMSRGEIFGQKSWIDWINVPWMSDPWCVIFHTLKFLLILEKLMEKSLIWGILEKAALRLVGGPILEGVDCNHS